MSGRETGGADDRLVVLLHGGAAGRSPWAESGATWSAVGERLEAAGFTCLAIDRPGHGGRVVGSWSELTFAAECEEVAEVIRRSGGTAHLVAHAEAGVTALLLAQGSVQEELGITVRSCAIVGGHGAEPMGDAPERIVLKHPPVGDWSPAEQRWAVRRLTYGGKRLDDREDTAAAETARSSARLVAEDGAAVRLAGDLLRAKGEIFAYARDHGYGVPISLTWGADDPLSETARAVELMNLLSTGDRHLELHLVDRAGHFVHRERPEELARLLEGFLDTVTGGAR